MDLKPQTVQHLRNMSKIVYELCSTCCLIKGDPHAQRLSHLVSHLRYLISLQMIFCWSVWSVVLRFSSDAQCLGLKTKRLRIMREKRQKIRENGEKHTCVYLCMYFYYLFECVVLFGFILFLWLWVLVYF